MRGSRMLILGALLCLLYAGCSQENETTFFPPAPAATGIQAVSTAGVKNSNAEYSYKYARLVEEPVNAAETLSTSAQYTIPVTTEEYIGIIVNTITSGYELKNDAVRSAFLGKLDALKKMYGTASKEAVLEKIENDLIPFTEKWVLNYKVIGFFLEALHILVSNNVSDMILYACPQCTRWFFLGVWLCLDGIFIISDTPAPIVEKWIRPYD